MSIWTRLLSAKKPKKSNSSKADMNPTADIVEKVYVQVVKFYQTNIADVNGATGITPLHIAAAVGDTRELERLLSDHADINAEDINGVTPLLLAMWGEHIESICFLMQHGAKTGEVSKKGDVTNVTLQGSVGATVLDAFRNLLSKAMSEMEHEQTKDVLEIVESRFKENFGAVIGLVERTLSDKQLHTKVIYGGGTRVWILISVLPIGRYCAANYFLQEYPPGYTGYLSFWMESLPRQIAQDMGQDVFAHLLIYADASSKELLSCGLGLLPLDQARQESNPKAVLPLEALTKEDRALLGI
jgi:hypothetical protein